MDLQKGKRKVIIDANVVLRYLLKDEISLYTEAEKIFNAALKGDIVAFIPSMVITEVVYVLQKVYKVDRKNHFGYPHRNFKTKNYKNGG